MQGFCFGSWERPHEYVVSSMDHGRPMNVGIGVLAVSAQRFLQRMGIARFSIFDPAGRMLDALRPG